MNQYINKIIEKSNSNVKINYIIVFKLISRIFNNLKYIYKLHKLFLFFVSIY